MQKISSRSIEVGSGYTRGNKWLSASKKVKEGKMIKIELELEGNIVKNAIISGDFFAYPPEIIEEMEAKVQGCELSKVLEVIEHYRDRVKLVGVKFDDLKELIRTIVEKN